jgi:hypothetical protein
MGIAKLYGQKATGININGIIKDYHAYAGENINAGDLVEYINGIVGEKDYGNSVNTQLSNSNGVYTKAVELQNGSIFITYGCSSTGGGDGRLHGMVVTVNGATINLGTETTLSSVSHSGWNVDKPILLPNGNVFIAHGAESTSSVLYGLVCSISGTTITAGTDTKLNDATKSGTAISSTLLPNGDVFVAHSYDTSPYLYGIVCSISGTTITKGTDKKLSGSAYGGYAMSAVTLLDGRVFIAYSNSSTYTLSASIYEVNDKVITGKGGGVLSSTRRTGQYISATLLPNGDVFVAHSYETSLYFYGIVASISGTTITAGTDTSLSANKTQYISTTTLRNGKVFTTRSYLGSYTLTAFVVVVDGMVITYGTETNLNMTHSEACAPGFSVLLQNNNLLVLTHQKPSYDAPVYGQIWAIDETNNVPTNHIITTEYETQVRKTTTSQFDGVAKTSGVGGTTTVPKDYVSVYTLGDKLSTSDGKVVMTLDNKTFLTK